MTRTRRRYSDDEKALAVGLAASLGPVRAARQLGIPARNVSLWMSEPRWRTYLEASHDQILETLRQASAAAASDLLRIIRDPNASDRDKVRASEVALDRYQLMSGGATERSENLNVEVQAASAYTTPEIRAQLAEWMAIIERATDEEMAQVEDKASRMLEIASNAALYDPDDLQSRAAYKRSLREGLQA